MNKKIAMMDKMFRRELLNAGPQRALWARFIAKAIDFAIVGIGVVFYYPMGLILGVVYLSISDSLYDGQSIGKRFMGFMVVSLVDGTPCSTKQSIIRNMPLVVPISFLIYPGWGWLVAAFLALPFTIVEVYLLFKEKTPHRLGDVLADTTVIANDGTRLDLRKRPKGWFEERHIPCNRNSL